MANNNNESPPPVYFRFTGQDRNEIPRNMTHLIIDSSVREIPEQQFQYFQSLIHVEIREGLQVIGRRAFMRWCRSLKTVICSQSLKQIRQQAFGGCQSLTNIDLNEGLVSIGKGAFAGCYSLKTFRIPATVTELGERVTYSCCALISIELPPNLQAIGYNFFAGCRELRNVAFPSSAEEFGVRIFARCLKIRRLFDEDYDLERDRNYLFERELEINNRLIKIFKERFTGLPIHELCYFQSYHPTAEVIEKLQQHQNVDDTVDCLGMTPFHILALSQKPNTRLFLATARLYPASSLWKKDVWGNPPIFYLCHNTSAASINMMESLIYLTMTRRAEFLGLARWRREILNLIDTLSTQAEQDAATQIDQVGQIYFALENLERVEVLSLVEEFLWKTKIAEANMGSIIGTEETVDRQGCRVNCGADVIIDNMLPYLDQISMLAFDSEG